jgi:hypothetical protein
MQCHVEMTEQLIDSWCQSGAVEIAQSTGPAVQSPEQIRLGMREKLATLRSVASGLYGHWLTGLNK